MCKGNTSAHLAVESKPLDRSGQRGIIKSSGGSSIPTWAFAELAMPTYEGNPKHGPKPRGTAKGVSSPAPADGQAALDASVQVKPTSPRRVGVDKANGEIVVLDEHLPGRFHGHVRQWDDLTPQMQRALNDAGLTDKQGTIL